MAAPNPEEKSESVGKTPEDRNRFVLPAPPEPLRENPLFIQIKRSTVGFR
jgi:hypothetical protein